MDRTETVHARGHEHVTAQHASTLEVTSDDWLTPAGDCIVAIESERVPSDFTDAFVAACRDHETMITARFVVDGHEQTVTGRGHPDLTFENDRSMVIRTSEYADDRTVMVGADTAAADLDRDLVTALANESELTVRFRVK